MKKYFTLMLLILFFAGCSEDEEHKPDSPATRMKKRSFVKPQTEDHRLKTADRQLPTADRRPQTANSRLPTSDRRPPTADRRLQTLDTAVIRKLIRLRSSELEIDLREPVSRAYLFSPVENEDFESMILLSQDRSIKINFDNDILDNTDRYYTNGIRFDFISPYLRRALLSYLMVPYWGKGINYYGISICQNMYTPSTTKIGGILYGDRPYAAYLFIGGFKISNDPERKFRQTTEIDLGVIGPSSYGDFVQKSFHSSVPTNNEPLGWEYQIQDDLVLNYNLSYEKGIISSRTMDLNLNAFGALGSLYTNMGGGLQFRAGKINSYFGSYGYSGSLAKKAKRYSKFQAFVFVTSQGKVVGYDATLEGGMFNKSSIYTLKSADLYRLVYQGTLGLTLAYAGFRFDVEQFLLSPEFHGCGWHKWVHIGVTFGM
jgi:hypothetical protein